VQRHSGASSGALTFFLADLTARSGAGSAAIPALFES
jgi:hypothetical protein